MSIENNLLEGCVGRRGGFWHGPSQIGGDLSSAPRQFASCALQHQPNIWAQISAAMQYIRDGGALEIRGRIADRGDRRHG
ncbi:MAG: hypothetical protein JNK46_08915 [Methylobacteriaceae bacterium]|nr:hypothetical protein [Methylobacteriaceae bacterium]